VKPAESVCLSTRKQLLPLLKAYGDTPIVALEEVDGLQIGRKVSLRRHLLLKALTDPAEVAGPPKLENLNSLDRILAFIFAARQRSELTAPDLWADAGFYWLAGRLGHFPVPASWPPPGGFAAAWPELESLLVNLLAQVAAFYEDSRVREVEAAHLALLWSGLSGRFLTLTGSVAVPHVAPTPDRWPNLPAWPVLRLTRNPEEANPKESTRKRLDKIERLMNDIVGNWWNHAGGPAHGWKIHKTVEKWDQIPRSAGQQGGPGTSCDPFSELLALCLHTGVTAPVAWICKQLGYRLHPRARPEQLRESVHSSGICAVLHELGEKLALAAGKPDAVALEKAGEAWRVADGMLHRALIQSSTRR
jgi:hypothetical protein